MPRMTVLFLLYIHNERDRKKKRGRVISSVGGWVVAIPARQIPPSRMLQSFFLFLISVSIATRTNGIILVATYSG
jgi:hypothetical protein